MSQKSLDKFKDTDSASEDNPSKCRYCNRMYSHRSNCPNYDGDDNGGRF